MSFEELIEIDKIKELISGMLNQEGVELVELSYHRQKQGMVLRFLIDKPNGISLDECSQINKEIGQALDDEDIIKKRYILEVSSPGLDRPLKTKQDFIRTIGKSIRVTTRLPVDGKRAYRGKLYGLKGQDIVIINQANEATVIAIEDIAKARLEI
jgi:ribosome maturation factor RimP